MFAVGSSSSLEEDDDDELQELELDPLLEELDEERVEVWVRIVPLAISLLVLAEVVVVVVVVAVVALEAFNVD